MMTTDMVQTLFLLLAGISQATMRRETSGGGNCRLYELVIPTANLLL